MNVLITGANGFVGKNLKELLEKHRFIDKVFAPSSKKLDLTSLNSVREFFVHQGDYIHACIHCAAVGGKRLQKQDPFMLQENIVMYQNLVQWFETQKNTSIFINIGSGAEFDREKDVKPPYNDEFPKDYYGLSKRLISEDLKARNKRSDKHFINLRAFGLFGPNEEEQRFVKSACLSVKNQSPIVIHRDRRMDFFGVEDLGQIVTNILEHNLVGYEELDLSYPERMLWLTDIGQYIAGEQVPIYVESAIYDRDYFGSSKLMKLFLEQHDIELYGQKELLRRMVKNEQH